MPSNSCQVDTQFLQNYSKAQTYYSEGKYSDSLKLFKSTLSELRQLIKSNDGIWDRIYLNCASSYAHNLDLFNKIDEENEIYEELIRYSPTEFYIGEYAIFLHKRKKDYNNSEKYYKLSLELYPYQASIHLKYAIFLRHIRQDITNATIHYQRATELNPNSSETLGNYASFLHSLKNYTEAKLYYQKANDIDQYNINNLCNYGLLLSEQFNQYSDAEKLYQQALLISNNQHSNTLYNYAVMLDSHCYRKTEAELLYRKTIELEPRHSYALYNLAVLLEDRQHNNRNKDNNDINNIPNTSTPTTNTNNNKDNKPETTVNESSPSPSNDTTTSSLLQEISLFYQRAAENDPDDAVILADYGRFQLIKMNNETIAEIALTRTLVLNKNSEVGLLNMSILLQRCVSNLLIKIVFFITIYRI